MTLECEFLYAMPDQVNLEVRQFFDSLECATIEQYPGWYDVRKDPGRLCSFVARVNGSIVAFAQVLEYERWVFRRAMLQFGPLYKDVEVLIESLRMIQKYYARRGFMYLSVQLAMPTGWQADLVEASLYRDAPFRQHFDRTHWSTLILDLRRSEEEILKGFADNHKGSIKKARKVGLTTAVAASFEDVQRLCEIYCSMKQERGLPVDREESSAFFHRLHAFFLESAKGFILLVRDPSNTPLGGVIIVRQGSTARYFLGATDPARKDVPVLHLGIFEAIRKSQAMECAAFDFWGYNVYAEEGEQIYHINRFKKWFSGSLLFYPKIMHFHIRPARYAAFQVLLAARERLRGIVGRPAGA